MPDSSYTGTIDWDDYWAGADQATREATTPSADLVLEPFLAFLGTKFPAGPGTYADVGCGPGDLVIAVADRFPDATAVGYDAAPAVLEANRTRARRAGVDATFERAVLPEFDPGRRFDVVSCLFTLCYVADHERALERLYAAVEPGGYLVLHYHNRFARAHYRSLAADPHEHMGDDAPWDPETVADRFELTISGENLLSYERIHDVLDTWPRSVFSAVEDAEPYRAHRFEPLVFVPK